MLFNFSFLLFGNKNKWTAILQLSWFETKRTHKLVVVRINLLHMRTELALYSHLPLLANSDQ